MTPPEIEKLIRTLAILTAAYESETEPLNLDHVDAASYTAGFRAGARSAYSDVVCRLRDLRADARDVTRIGAAS